MKILITGTSGFVGSNLLETLVNNNEYEITCAQRVPHTDHKTFHVEDLANKIDWQPCLQNIDVVIHTAGRAHVFDRLDQKSKARFFAINTDATTELARQAAQNGVRRFIFLSSIKVHGEFTKPGTKFNLGDQINPVDAYGQSKHLAELGLWEISKKMNMEIVIIRPPLIYGPEVKGNFRSLINVIRRGVPLPLKHINHKRTLIGIDNLIQFIDLCIQHPAAKNNTFLIGDPEDVSIEELFIKLAEAMDLSAKLFYVPQPLLASIASIARKKHILRKLTSPLQVDTNHARSKLGWEPTVCLEEGLLRCFNLNQ